MPYIPYDNATEQTFVGAQQTVVQVGGEQMAITIKDASAIRYALLEYLRTSTIEDAQYLLRMTEAVPAWIDPDRIVRIGAWLLQAKGDSLVMTYRMLPGPPVIRSFVVTVVKNANKGWMVSDLREERIIPRR